MPANDDEARYFAEGIAGAIQTTSQSVDDLICKIDWALVLVEDGFEHRLITEILHSLRRDFVRGRK